MIAVDPGLTDTELTRNLPMMKSITSYLIYPLFWPFMKNPRMGSQPIVHAAIDSSTEKCTGDYFVLVNVYKISFSVSNLIFH